MQAFHGTGVEGIRGRYTCTGVYIFTVHDRSERMTCYASSLMPNCVISPSSPGGTNTVSRVSSRGCRPTAAGEKSAHLCSKTCSTGRRSHKENIELERDTHVPGLGESVIYTCEHETNAKKCALHLLLRLATGDRGSLAMLSQQSPDVQHTYTAMPSQALTPVPSCICGREGGAARKISTTLSHSPRNQ